LCIQERVIGVLGVDNRVSKENLTRRDVTLLSALADYAAIAINNARVYTRTQQTLRQRTREMSALQAMGKAAAEPSQVRHIAWQALKHAIQVTDAIGGVVGLQNGHLANGLAAFGEQEGAGKIMWVNLDGSLLKPEPRMESVVRHALVLGQPQWTQNRTFPAYLATPIQQGSKTVGAIGLQIHATPLPDYGHHIEARIRESLRFLEELADRVAEQLLHTRLFVEAAAAQQRTNLVLANISEGVCTVDRDLRITSANLAMEHVTGWSQDELLGRRYDTIFAPQVDGKRLPAEQTLPGKALQESAVITTRSTILHKDGRRIPVTGTAALLRDTGGAVVGVLATVRALAEDAPRVQPEPMRDTFDPLYYHPVTLKPVIDQLVRNFQEVVADRSFQVRLAGDLPFVMGDERKIELALASLIDDALARGDPGQPIVIAADATDDRVVVAVEVPAGGYEKPLRFSLPTLEVNNGAQSFSD
jgi:PAS domain S-box-containing protein